MNFILLMILLTISIAALVSLHLLKKKSASSKLLDEVRARAAIRAHERAFADTESEDDPYGTSLDLAMAMSATEVDDRFDGRGELSEEQVQTISLIFDGFKPDPVQEPKKMHGATAHAKAGVPWSQSVFGDMNQVETIVVDDIWDSKYNRA